MKKQAGNVEGSTLDSAVVANDEQNTATVTGPEGDTPTSKLARREFLRLSATAAAAIPLSGALAACGDDDDDDATNTGDDDDDATATGDDDDDATATGDDDDDATATGDDDDDVTGDDDDDTSPEDPSTIDGGTEVAFDPASVSEDLTLFRSVLSGAARADSILLSGYAEDGAAKRLRVWRASETAGSIVLVKDVDVTPVEKYLKQAIDGLAPAQTYFYAFFTDDRANDEGALNRSPIGRFKTAFAAGALLPVTVGATTCTNFRFRPYSSLSLMAEEELDAFIQLGDFVYMDDAEDVLGKTLAGTLEEYRTCWKETLIEPGYKAVLEKNTSYTTLDDHEIIDSGPLYSQPAERYEIAMKAFFEVLPVPNLKPNTVGREVRFWDSYRWGDSVEFFVVDSRLHRDPATRLGPDAEYLGREQMDWLKQALDSSPCVFKVILNSVPILNFTFAVSEDDRWQGFPAQREELLNWILAQDIRNVVFLTGDFHMEYVARIDAEGPTSRIWEVMCGPGASAANPLKVTASDPKSKDRVFPPEQFPFVDFGTKNATVITFDPLAKTFSVKFTEADTGKVLHEATYPGDAE